MEIYNDASATGKREILQWAHELPQDLALTILRRALTEEEASASDDEDVPDQHSLPNHGFHTIVWNSLVFCWQQWQKRWFHRLNEDIVTRAQSFSSPLDVAATIIALVDYAIEFRRVPVIVSRVIDHIIDRGADAAPKLRAYVAQHSSALWGGMTPAQRDRFLSVYDEEVAPVF